MTGHLEISKAMRKKRRRSRARGSQGRRKRRAEIMKLMSPGYHSRMKMKRLRST
jgi:hypothetical protein